VDSTAPVPPPLFRVFLRRDAFATLSAIPETVRRFLIGKEKLKGNMKKILTVLAILAAAGIADAQNIPSGITGLWRFQDSANLGAATVGNSIMFSNAPYGAQMSGPWTVVGPYSDGAVFQESSWNYMAVNPAFTANGGGTYVNKYTVAIDYVQTSGLTTWNSLFQTAWGGNDNEGDLWTDGAGHIGVGAVGYSTSTYDASTWHRIVWSIDNGNFFRVYVDGTLFLDGTPQPVDGRFSLYPDRFNLFADNAWYDQWGLVGTVATWNRALTTDEVAGMGGWIGGSSTPTPLVVPEPATMWLLALGGLALLRRNRK